MSKIIIGTLALAAGLVFTACHTGPTVHSGASMDQKLEQLKSEGEAAKAEVERWVEDYKRVADKESADSGKELNARIEARFAAVRKSYEKLLRRYPRSADAHIAYAEFLTELHDEDGSKEQLEKALPLDPKNPHIYNDLANIYGHCGSVKKAFEYYAKAIDLDPAEPVFYHNFGTTVYLFRKDAKEYYSIGEQEVFDKALGLYSNSMRLDPTNFALASDVALSYYGIKPWRFEAAMQSWTNALQLAQTELEREEVYTHFARVETQAGRFAEARAHLAAVSNEKYAKLKERMLRNIEEHEKAGQTNSPGTEKDLKKGL